MNESSLKEKTAKGLFWGGISNTLQQLLGLLFGIFLARLLTPDDYGMVGMLTIFSATAMAIQEGGFISALTNLKQISHKDYNAVFWLSFFCSVFIYLLLYLLAPAIAHFYQTPQLIPLSRVSFLGFILASLSIAPRAVLFRNLKTKENTIISITALIISGTTGIILAANGFAYWGITFQTLIYILVITILTFYFAKWKPSLTIDLSPIKKIFGFSSKLLITNIFNVINNNLFSLLLGKFYGEREVGNYTQANKWNTMGHTLISGMINGIAQPVLTQVTDDKTRQLNIFRKMLRFTALISFPAMLGLSLVSKELILITITAKWLSSADILQMLCIGGAFIPIASLFSNLIISRGHSSIFMGNTITLSVCQIIAACLMYPYGLFYMISVFILINILWIGVWTYFAHREINLTLWHVLKDISPYLLLSAGLTISAYYLTLPIENIYLRLLTKIIFVATLYPAILWKMQSVIFRECIQFIKARKV